MTLFVLWLVILPLGDHPRWHQDTMTTPMDERVCNVKAMEWNYHNPFYKGVVEKVCKPVGWNP